MNSSDNVGSENHEDKTQLRETEAMNTMLVLIMICNNSSEIFTQQVTVLIYVSNMPSHVWLCEIVWSDSCRNIHVTYF